MGYVNIIIPLKFKREEKEKQFGRKCDEED